MIMLHEYHFFFFNFIIVICNISLIIIKENELCIRKTVLLMAGGQSYFNCKRKIFN